MLGSLGSSAGTCALESGWTGSSPEDMIFVQVDCCWDGRRLRAGAHGFSGRVCSRPFPSVPAVPAGHPRQQRPVGRVGALCSWA